MSDNEEQVDEKPFCVDRAKSGRAGCKKCKQKCESGELRLAKLQYSPFTSGKMKCWHHVDCLMEVFLKQRPSTKRIENTEEIDGWDNLNQEDQDFISKKLEECEKAIAEKYGAKATPKKSPKKSPKAQSKADVKPKLSNEVAKVEPKLSSDNEIASKNKDSLFREFRKLVADITNVSSYTEKTALVKKMFTQGIDGAGFKGDIKLWCRLLLPGVVKRIYNLQSKQLVKLFSKIFSVDHNDMLEHLEQGDIGETIQHFFEISTSFKPTKKSTLTVVEVDTFLEELSGLTKEDEQTECIKDFAKKCTSNDLKIVIRLIKHDLRMNAGAKHILDGVHPDAYQAHQSSRDLDAVIDRCLGGTSKQSGKITTIKATIAVMTPVLPMLAEACKSVEQAMKKCPNGMYSEIKYDGERVQVHKEGSNFKYFSRSLKPVLPHKVAHFKNYIPKAFPHGKDLILDSEILMIDTNTGKPLPFGTLGIHKKTEFKDACVCLFIFDCIYYNGESLTDKPIKLRKQILKENMTEIPNHIVFSEMEEISKPDDLKAMIARVLTLGLEGLVLKDLMSIYEPGKRHWLKVKKDYLFDGAMADSADLIVLGAWYGTGKKGGMMSIFLMGCYDPNRKRFCTVTKVHTGHDDKTLERLQEELDMEKISCDASKVPDWLHCTKTMIPDFVAKDPKNQPVWEITGAEFTKHDVHTAEGISIRFPRVTKIREDKTWEEATNLQELDELYKTSKENTDVSMLVKMNSDNNDKILKRKKDNEDLGESSIKKQRKNKGDDEDASSKENSLNNNNKKCIDAEDSEKKIKEPIPDYFQNVLLLVEDAARQKYSQWIRYFIAYGGVVLNNDDWKPATHVLHRHDTASEGDVPSPKAARHVIVEWIKDSIAKGAMQDYKPYSVRLKPLEDNDSSLKI